ncbi:class I SAM-dependent methyltransferase [Azospirillum doebereinerae]|uniref:Class I SAM-dependent methyltransferase n=1 Tax=Azospirillum doebereinerae TaxID=92933 RepID=A0A3S0XA44_9PROT|nr:class I SAM-dependent methyltransferase [Azospirillum doebereinerae]RUQ68853.1 class I SAM-dependent methyltransferase [Azospirillum doebereinerae]
MSSDSSHYMFKHHPETCDPDDHWGQVKRTINGKPVSPEQIALIVTTIKNGLSLAGDDVLLDLCCGNGALTTHLFEICRGGLGVDYSDFLIGVANQRFTRGPSERYRLADALDYVRTESDPQAFTKILCYGAFPYFSHDAAHGLLQGLSERFDRATHLFLGQMPDKTRMKAFFADRDPAPGEEDDPASLLGIWRTPAELAALAEAAGWTARCERMPAHFFASHYRFDAVLTRS